MVMNKEWDQLVTMTTDPAHYLDCLSGAEKLRRDVQATDFLRKSDAVPASFDRVKKAVDNFDLCENKCLETNYLLDFLAIGGDGTSFADECNRILRRARKIVKKVLGPLPPFLEGGFGPGTSFELKGSAYTTLADKLWITPAVTRDAEAVWRHTVEGSILDRRRLELGLPYRQIVRGNRFTTVPKDAKTDRGICIEPLGNLYCQLGVGRHLKGRLKKVGLFVHRSDIPGCPISRLQRKPSPNGQDVHRKLAAMASMDGRWATIDLSNASDTVAYNLVRELLPRTWFELFRSLRSPATLMPNGKWVKLEKFSSMGNGFTFELETLIFAALAAAVSDLEMGVNLFVYGDDIIVPTHASRNVLAVLQTFGFDPNRSKTFTTGPFRESCGGDFFDGWSVRAYFSTSEPSSPLEWIAMHNKIRSRWPHFRTVKRCIVEQIPERFRKFGPSWLEDIVLHDHSKQKWDILREGGITSVRGIKAQPVKIPLDRWGSEFTVSLALLGVASTGITPRGAVSGWRTHAVSIS